MCSRTMYRRWTLSCSMLAVVALGLIVCDSSAAADWARFRGPNGSGLSRDEQTLPQSWSPTENLSWKVELPGPGSSAPIVVNQHVYVTCWSGYGTDRGNPGDQQQLRRHLVCLDRNTGKIAWSQPVKPTLPEDEYGGMFAEHGYASHTPTSDGERVYVYFGKTGALAFDLEGNPLWHTPIGTESDPRGWGSASSPILFNNLLIVTASAECEALVGLDTKTGKELWRQEAAGLNATWGTPVLVRVDEERTDLVIGVPNEIWGLNPNTGKLRWYCEAMPTDSFCSSVVAHEGTVYAVEGRSGGAIAVRAGGNGNVTDSHVIWSDTKSTNRIGTPIVFDGRIYFFSRGFANCMDAQTGQNIFKSRLESAGADNQQSETGAHETGNSETGADGNGKTDSPEGTQLDNAQADRGRGKRGGRRFGGGGGFGGDYASPVMADGKIFVVTRPGITYVLKASEKFEQLAVNRLTVDREDFSATPAISDGQIFIRSSRHIYCIAADGAEATTTQ